MELKLYLTAGVNVAPAVLAQIDTDHDGVFSPAEQQAYADQVRQDLSVNLDGEPLTLRLGALTFPPAEGVRQGLADIRMTMKAEAPSGEGSRKGKKKRKWAKDKGNRSRAEGDKNTRASSLEGTSRWRRAITPERAALGEQRP